MASFFSYINWNGDPVIFEIAGVPLRWYSLCFAAAFLTSYQILKVRFHGERIPIRLLDQLTIYIVVGTIIGARLGHCLFYDFPHYKDHLLEIVLPFQLTPDFKFVGYQGLASHGGAVGILISIIVFSRKYQVPLYWVLDRISLVIPLAGFFIRVGNFLNSEIIGKPSTLPWAIIFEKEDDIPRHPAQLYEALLYLGIFVILQVFVSRVDRRDGFIFGAFLIMLFSVRFLVEFWKENQVQFENGMPINLGQVLSIPFIVFGIVLLSRDRKAQLE